MPSERQSATRHRDGLLCAFIVELDEAIGIGCSGQRDLCVVPVAWFAVKTPSSLPVGIFDRQLAIARR